MSGALWNAGTIDEAGMRDLAARLAVAAREGGMIHLEGDLGAGKTTFARALLTSLGVGERVKSPTYSLVESYRIGDRDAHHLDLYRIADASELEWLGLGDLWGDSALVLVEWPERARGALPTADLVLHLRHAGERRGVVAEALSARGQRFLAAMRGDAKTVG
ncbi:MAG TPA: tRNA (adenosine(37)-N6)-threonylcarbamoyltransferase complex ATPase subunit type 1 TsaE [Rhodanobacteraceae bacterium]|jgi:tRNA threonylcarbamoyladenosine biosynthesis protein TsaE|nr:tRNA (adenosine(37)-N6)-threonylcarbamoyltransferase complex ATPase subunit type 1 TsaE [Rhodanobacteraceae bacterium]